MIEIFRYRSLVFVAELCRWNCPEDAANYLLVWNFISWWCGVLSLDLYVDRIQLTAHISWDPLATSPGSYRGKGLVHYFSGNYFYLIRNSTEIIAIVRGWGEVPQQVTNKKSQIPPTKIIFLHHKHPKIFARCETCGQNFPCLYMHMHC